MQRTSTVLGVLFVLTVTTPLAVQTSGSPQPDAQACAEQQELRRSGKLPPSDESLSERLAESRGVVCPPSAVDPEIKTPAPEGGRIEVIPPPGSPGGNPRVLPK